MVKGMRGKHMKVNARVAEFVPDFTPALQLLKHSSVDVEKSEKLLILLLLFKVGEKMKM